MYQYVILISIAEPLNWGFFYGEKDLEWLTEQLQAFQWGVTGFIGALVASWFRRDDLPSKRDFVVFACAGAAIAHFLTGMVAAYLDVSPANAGGIGFLLGLFGGTAVQSVIRAIRAADLWQFIMSRWGK